MDEDPHYYHVYQWIAEESQMEHDDEDSESSSLEEFSVTDFPSPTLMEVSLDQLENSADPPSPPPVTSESSLVSTPTLLSSATPSAFSIVPGSRTSPAIMTPWSVTQPPPQLPMSPSSVTLTPSSFTPTPSSANTTPLSLVATTPSSGTTTPSSVTATPSSPTKTPSPGTTTPSSVTATPSSSTKTPSPVTMTPSAISSLMPRGALAPNVTSNPPFHNMASALMTTPPGALTTSSPTSLHLFNETPVYNSSSNIPVPTDTGEPVASKSLEMVLGKGKKKDPVWLLFTEVEENTISDTGALCKKRFQKFNACGLQVSAKADRMRKHVSTGCRPQRFVRAQRPTAKPDSISSVGNDYSEVQVTFEANSTLHTTFDATTSKTKQQKVNAFVNKTTTTKAQRKDLDMLAAKFWYASNLAFSAANLRTWKDFCAAMRPGYDPPSEDMLSGSLLDTTYSDLRKQMEKDLMGKEGTLIQDGWSNIHNAPILSHSVICNGEAYLVNSIECKGEKKTAAYCASKFEETMLQLKSQGFEVVAGSTDNCNTMIAMRRILQSKYPHLFLYGCTPRMLNKLCEEVSPKEILVKINEVSKFFRDHHTPAALLADRKGLKPQLPASTRWISHLECVRTFLANRTKYIEIGQIQSACPEKIIESVNSLEIFRSATLLLSRMEVISVELLKSQEDRSNVSDAVHSWLKLYNNPILSSHKTAVKSKMDIAIEPFFFVAYLMHPKYQGELLSSDQRDQALDLMLDKSPEYVTVAHAFLSKDTTFFPKSALHEAVMNSSHPANWWNSLNRREGIPCGLIDFLRPMYRCPSSTASIERVFSTYGFVQTEHRNRLTQDKVMKLSFNFRALRKQDEAYSRKRKLMQANSSET